MAAWVTAISDVSNTEQTVTDYDARGNVAKVTRYSTLPSGGGGGSGTPVAVDSGTATTITNNGDGTYRVLRPTGGFLGWQGDARSSVGVSGDFVVQMRVVSSLSDLAVGVSASPASSTSYTNLNYGFMLDGGGGISYTESGTTGSLSGTYSAGDNFWLVRSGTTLTYYQGATLAAAMASTPMRTVTGVSGTLYLDTSHYTKNVPVDVAFTSGIPSAPSVPLDASVTNYVYDQAGNLLSKGVLGLNAQS
jgi:hypothetical protein